jgi:chromate reductase, NAD(P)H dehydrogenase (quinone)
MLVSGSTRAASGSTAALRTAQALAADAVTAGLYDGLAGLPAFNPDDDHDPLPPPVQELRQQIAAADAILFCTPEYAGTLPGSLKNLLDWTVGGGEMNGKPAGWINVAVGGRGRGAAEHLAMVLRYVGAVAVEQACLELPVPRESVGADGLIADPAIRAGLTSAMSALAESAARLPVTSRRPRRRCRRPCQATGPAWPPSFPAPSPGHMPHLETPGQALAAIWDCGYPLRTL